MTKLEAVQNFCLTVGQPFTVKAILTAVPDLDLKRASAILSTLRKRRVIKKIGISTEGKNCIVYVRNHEHVPTTAKRGRPRKHFPNMADQTTIERPSQSQRSTRPPEKGHAKAALKRAFAADPSEEAAMDEYDVDVLLDPPAASGLCDPRPMTPPRGLMKPLTRNVAPSSLSLEDVGAAVMGHVERLERRIATLEGQAKDAATQARLRAAEHRRALDEKEQEKRRLADTIVELNARIAALQVVRRPAVAVGRFFESF